MVVNLSPAFGEETGVDPFLEGVFILRVAKGSNANRLQFRAGDIVKNVNGREIENVNKLLDELKNPTSHWRISILRNGKVRKMLIKR